MSIHIGIDDTDTRLGGCTTFLASKVVSLLVKKSLIFTDYANLVRLNPNIPWKTRGNAAIALRFLAERPEDIFTQIWRLISENSGEGASPGLVMFTDKIVPHDVRSFYEKTLSEVVSLKEAKYLIRKHEMTFYTKGNGMGLIGSLAAIGGTLEGDHTYELLAYRGKANCGSKRHIDFESVMYMSNVTAPYTYSNYDPETDRILVTPHGPDPVLFGIRGETPKHIINAYHMLKVKEPVECYLIFRTNQGTGLHLTQELNLRYLKAYSSGHIIGTVSQRPWVGRGGHVYFKLKQGESEAPCAVYEPSGGFRRFVLRLIPGDEIEAGVGIRKRTVRHPTIMNAEYVKVINLVEDYHYSNPICNACGKRMTSQGRGNGFRCDKCGFEDKITKKVVTKIPRTIERGLYLPPPRAHRHLTKPLQRYGLEKREWDGIIAKDWFWFP